MLKDNPLVFLHIQRCGGTTLTNLLDLHFRNDQILKANLLHGEQGRILGISGHTGTPFELDDGVANYRLIAGHSNFGDLDAILTNPVYVTMLRDPIQRVVSLYRYWKSHRLDYIEKHGLRGPLLAKRLSLEELVQSDEPEALYNVHNGMARQLVNHLIAPIDLSDEEWLKRAGENLDRFTFVGISELYDLSVNLLCESLGWSPVTRLDTANTYAQTFGSPEQFEAIPDEVLTPQTAAVIIERNWIDLQLYQRALRRLGRRFGQSTSAATPDARAAGRQPPLLLKKIARRLTRILTDYVHPA